MKPKHALLLNLLAVVCAAVAAYLQAQHPKILTYLCREDFIIEMATALCYFGAAGLFVWSCRIQGFKNVWCWGFAAMFFLVGAEEISWGQRIFGFGTPTQLQSVNVQREFNFHNLDGIHGNVRAAGLLLIGVLCYLMPLSNQFVAPMRSLYQKLRLPVCPLWASGIVTIAVLFMAYPRFVLGRIIFNTDEVGEFLLGMAFLAFAVDALLNIRSGSGPARASVPGARAAGDLAPG